MRMFGQLFVAGVAGIAGLKLLAALLFPALGAVFGFLFLMFKIFFFVGLGFLLLFFIRKMMRKELA